MTSVDEFMHRFLALYVPDELRAQASRSLTEIVEIAESRARTKELVDQARARLGNVEESR